MQFFTELDFLLKSHQNLQEPLTVASRVCGLPRSSLGLGLGTLEPRSRTRTRNNAKRSQEPRSQKQVTCEL
jgi:hypothetical protein